MSLPAALSDLLNESAYPHPCSGIDVVETHISWVLLTGEFVYKIKKPVQFSFVDFSTLELRRHFCEEELRCNRRFAPSLYLGLVRITRRDGSLVMDGDSAAQGGGEAEEWAVKMRQFPPEAQLDRLLARSALTPRMLDDFGRTLALQHRELPSRRLDAADLEARVLAPVRDNFRDLENLDWLAGERDLLDRTRQASEALAEGLRGRLAQRLEAGETRECHGDLHLSNLVALEDGVCAFDCLEFDPDLRWIDPQSDVAFLFMDCLVRHRADLGYAFVDGYLGTSGDYAGATLLGFYAAYRAMVRAKVSALRRDQADAVDVPALERKVIEHIRWAGARLTGPPGRLVLMCGLSGSGKSFLARRLVPRLPALRLRSDVARKVRAGLAPEQPASAAVGEGLYAPERTEALYDWLARITTQLLRGGEHVIVDATFLDAGRRQAFFDAAARAQADAVIVLCDAPLDVLESRIRQRAEAGGDPSDADLEVLAHQRRQFELPEHDVLRIDTSEPLDDTGLTELAAALTRTG
jgi:aminoglycoside phosphotransferase family enzyme/predicted kinase